MSNEEQIKRDKVLKYKCLTDLQFFWRYFFKKQNGFKANIAPHHTKICETLHKVAKGEITRLIINIPPRYGKTDIAVKAFIAWQIANNPKSKFIHISYSDDLVQDNSSAIKELVEDEEYQRLFDVRLKKDTRSKKKWYTTEGGGVYAAASGAAITGFGAGSPDDEDPEGIDDFFSDGQFGSGAIVIDDPIKPDDANSSAVRTKINERYNGTIRSRANSRKVPIVIIMQRIHENDMSGFLLDGGSGEEWEHLNIPALDESDQAIWPFKHTTEELHQMRAASPYVFAGQYGQNPAPPEGGIFKGDWLNYYTQVTMPEMKYTFITADTAQKVKEQNDSSVLQWWGYGIDDNLYFLDMARGKWEAPKLEQVFKEFYKKCSSLRRVRCCYIEDKASGTGLIQSLKSYGRIPIKAVQRNVDKVVRANDTAPWVYQGKIYINKDIDQWGEMKNELLMFPNAKHDDCVDPLMDAVQIAFSQKKTRGAVSYG